MSEKGQTEMSPVNNNNTATNNTTQASIVSKEVTVNITAAVSSSSVRQRHARMLQDFFLIWLDSNIDENNKSFQDFLTELRSIFVRLELFTNVDECISYMTSIGEEKIILITSGTLGESTVHVIHDMVQLYAILVFCVNVARHEEWATKWPKVRCVAASIKYICESLRKIIRQSDRDSISMSFVSKQTTAKIASSENKNANELDPSYMYSMFFKEIVLEIDEDNGKQMRDFIDYCHEKGIPDSEVSKFHSEYQHSTPVRLYTSQSFVFGMLNYALRTLDMETMVKMGFFIRNLHLQLEQLYHEQSHIFKDEILVYRGQRLSSEDFQRLCDTKGGLLAFNNFLSTSMEKSVATLFSPNELDNRENIIGVLFIMTINPDKVVASATPFALVEKYSVFQEEKEILFSMHVFRIQDINESAETKGLWEVQLTLTDDNDPQLTDIMSDMRPPTQGFTGWYRMSNLMLTVGHFKQAEILFNELLKNASSDDERADLNHHLGGTKFFLGQYKEAVKYCEEELKIKLKSVSENDPSMAGPYSNIGGVYRRLGDYSKALEYYNKTLEIAEKSLPPNHPTLGFYYNETGLVYADMGNYEEGLQFFEKSHKINEKLLSPSHPGMATSYSNIGAIYFSMGDCSKALQLFEKALKIREKFLAPGHHHLACSYDEIGTVYDKMGDYSKALQFYEKSVRVREQTLPKNHPDLAASYYAVGRVYDKMGDYSKAHQLYEKFYKMTEQTSLTTDSDLAHS